MNEERLLKLAAFLDKLPPERFNFNVWVGDTWKETQDLSCGTSACAMGWAATMPEFRKLGVRLCKRGGLGIVAMDIADIGYIKGGCNVAEHLFEISEKEAEHLFVPHERENEDYDYGYDDDDDDDLGDRLGRKATPKEVAAHIRAFVERGGIYE